MPEEIVIKAGASAFKAQLNDSATAKVILDALPIRARAQRWGGEIYFSIPVDCQLEENSREVMAEGELGYWPRGRAFCMFFGPTPASRGDEIRAASPVSTIGRMKPDWSALWDVRDGADVSIERV